MKHDKQAHSSAEPRQHGSSRFPSKRTLWVRTVWAAVASCPLQQCLLVKGWQVSCRAAHSCAPDMSKCVVQGPLVSHSDVHHKDEMWHSTNWPKRVVCPSAISGGVCWDTSVLIQQLHRMTCEAGSYRALCLRPRCGYSRVHTAV